MADLPPPKSPTLLPPRKSVELEDPGAHDLDTSSDDADVFTDARDEPSSPLPITRVEKVDDVPSHGQVPGTAAYEMRTQDAVPDEIAVIPDGQRSRPSSRASQRGTHQQIPKTVVEKVNLENPTHGEVRGTAAAEIRKADAVPDLVLRASDKMQISTGLDGKIESGPASPVPKTVLTRADSQPSYGQVPGTLAHEQRKQDADFDEVDENKTDPSLPTSVNRSSYFGGVKPTTAVPRDALSPIAADGGFGPMTYEDDGHDVTDDEDTEDDKPAYIKRQLPATTEEPPIEKFEGNALHIAAPEEEEDEDEEFEEGAEVDDFGDFDDGLQEPESEESEDEIQPVKHPIAPLECSFPILDFSTPHTLESLKEALEPHLAAMFPATTSTPLQPPPSLPDSTSPFLTDRSLSLWNQLVSPPPLQPPNWTRSRIRRLFLVSLGVPVDLDEILPKSKQKKLILPYTPDSSAGTRKGPLQRLKTQGLDNVDDSSNPNTPTTAGGSRSRRRKGPAPPPEWDAQEARSLGTFTEEALRGMDDGELQRHLKRVEDLCKQGQEVLEYWMRRQGEAAAEKEAFDGVIENLVRHARRVRK